MGSLTEENGNILSFTLFKLERGREKICKCNPPHYEIDLVNRIVVCTDCGAVLDAFDALVTLCGHIKEYEEYQEEAVKKINTYKEMADKELRRRFKNRAFKEMDRQYHSGMFPCCPECGGIFNPAEITGWTNKRNYKKRQE